MKISQFFSVAACLYLCRVQCANILGVFMLPSISHQIVYQALWKELSLRGHQVTVLTSHPLNDPELVNLTEIDLGFSNYIWTNANIQSYLHKDLPYSQLITSVFEILGKIAKAQILHPKVQAFVHNESQKFDVMIVEFVHPLMYALSAKFNCPMIGITSFGTFVHGHDAVGNPSHPVLTPDLIFPSMENTGFLYRFYSTYFSMRIRYHYYYNVLPKYDTIARKYIGQNIPYLGDIERNVSLLLLNVNPILHSIRPNVPAVIELGGMHFNKKKPLPIDLQIEMDDAKNGIVYFSLGSNVKSVNLPLKVRQKLLKVLSELPYKVLWKWEDDHLPGQPKNVVIRKWFPQQDILRHPNIKVFLTQGGLQSLEEAITNQVPLVIMPFYADQPLNARKMVHMGAAIAIDIEKVTIKQLKEALVEVAENPRYRNNIKRASVLLSDVPMTGLEKAVWWTEYVIRHKGARHLRSPAIDIPWYQYLLLDVLGVLIAVVISSICIVYVCIVGSSKFIKSKSFKLKYKTL